MAAGKAACIVCGRTFGQAGGVWNFMPDVLDSEKQTFIRAYHRIREDEGWVSDDGVYYRRLPEVSADDPQRSIWRLRQQSFETLMSQVIGPLEEALGRILTVVDAGAGNGWLSNQLACRGHRVVAVDIQDDRRHGLGAHVHYHTSFVPVKTSFDRLPLDDGAVDVVVFNASFH